MFQRFENIWTDVIFVELFQFKTRSPFLGNPGFENLAKITFFRNLLHVGSCRVTTE